MEEVALFLDDLRSSAAIPHCRICHEAEFESSRGLEAPCACSGTVKVSPSTPKAILFGESFTLDHWGSIPIVFFSRLVRSIQFAHRDCIQRWCDEKGDTVCEICLQVTQKTTKVFFRALSEKAPWSMFLSFVGLSGWFCPEFFFPIISNVMA